MTASCSLHAQRTVPRDEGSVDVLDHDGRHGITGIQWSGAGPALRFAASPALALTLLELMSIPVHVSHLLLGKLQKESGIVVEQVLMGAAVRLSRPHVTLREAPFGTTETFQTPTSPQSRRQSQIPWLQSHSTAISGPEDCISESGVPNDSTMPPDHDAVAENPPGRAQRRDRNEVLTQCSLRTKSKDRRWLSRTSRGPTSICVRYPHG